MHLALWTKQANSIRAFKRKTVLTIVRTVFLYHPSFHFQLKQPVVIL